MFNQENELIHHGACRDIRDAIQEGYLPAVKYYGLNDDKSINKTIRLFCSPLVFASMMGDSCIVRHLLLNGAQVNDIDDAKTSSLQWACRRSHVEVVIILLRYGANVNHQNETKMTALHHAVAAKNFELVRMLSEKSADPTLKNIVNETPLDLARKLKLDEIINYLESNWNIVILGKSG